MACILIFALVGCGSSTETAPNSGDTVDTGTAVSEKIVWKMAHTVPEETSLHQASLELAENVAARTDGNFVIEIYPNGALGGNRETIEGMQFGTIELNIPNVGMLSGYSPSIDVLQLPYLIDSVDDIEGTCDIMNSEIMDPVREELSATGILWGASWYQGYRHLTTSKTPVHTPDDMKGLKIRTMESELHMAHFNALGANAVPMAFSEVFTALQQGAIDGQENPYVNIYTQGMHEVQGYVIETAHICDVLPFLVSKSAYEALPTEYQTIFDEELEKMNVKQWLASEQQAGEYKQKILDSGKCEIIELTQDERQAFQDAAQVVYDAYANQIGADLIQAFRDAQK